MDLIVCVDDKMGMAFNRRRQSRDILVCQDIAEFTKGKTVAMNERSVKLFEGLEIDITTDPEKCDFYFLEFLPPSALEQKPHRLVIYRWNRHYPADVHFDIPLEGYRLFDSWEFQGNSHDLITREVYVNEER